MHRKVNVHFIFFFQAEDGIRDWSVTGVQTCAFFFSSRRRHTRLVSDWSSDVCSSDLGGVGNQLRQFAIDHFLAIALAQWNLLMLENHRSEEHTSELQSLTNLVCRLLLEKKKNGALPDSLRCVIANREGSMLCEAAVPD